jgi:heat shock protein HslJ
VTYNNGNNGLGNVLQDSSISVAFTPGGQINGFSGCNQYSATYTLNNQNIGISQVTGSKSGCIPNLSMQETQYQALLTRANSYEVSGNQLTIFNALGDKILIFNRGTATVTSAPTVTQVTTPKTILGTWELKSYSDGMGGTIQVLDSAPVTAMFARTGNLSGSAGCNQYITSYTVTGLSITVSPVSTTKMSCAPDVMAQETAYISLLGKAGKINLYGDSMTLSDPSGTLLLNFKAAP